MRAYNICSMRSGMAIAAFALMLAVPLWAQRGGGGGGHGGGGHAGGFGGGGHVSGFGGGGHAGGFSGYHGSSGFSGGSSHLPPTFGFTHPPTGSFAPPTSPLVRQPYATNGYGRGYVRNGFGPNGFARNGFGRSGFGNNRFRDGGVSFHIRSYPYWGWGYPYWGWGYFDPWWGWWGSEDNSYDNSDYDNNLATAEQMNADNLQEMQMLRQEQMDGDQDAYQGAYNQGYADAEAQNQRERYNQYAPVHPPLDPERMQEAERSHEQTADSKIRPTVLVFRDQHKQEVQNYAIVADMLWDFAPQQTVKIPLSELDIPATVKANQDRGIRFSVPASAEGQ